MQVTASFLCTAVGLLMSKMISYGRKHSHSPRSLKRYGLIEVLWLGVLVTGL